MTEPAVMMWFDGDEKDLEALVGIFGSQPQVLKVIRPDGTVRYRGWARLWPESYFEKPHPPVDWEDAVARLALAHGWGEVGLMRECQERGLNFARALKIYRSISHRSKGQRGFTPLPRRWVIERSFGRLNRYRRLSRDFIHLMLRKLTLSI